jgi:predicted nucleic acid-binding protein
MGQEYLIDTNVIIDAIANKLPDGATQLLVSNELIVSAVTKIETLGWKNAPKQELNTIYDLMGIAVIVQIDDTVIDKAILIRQRKIIKLGDAIIAATALVHHYTLVTRNIADFKGIEDLKLINPYEL